MSVPVNHGDDYNAEIRNAIAGGHNNNNTVNNYYAAQAGGRDLHDPPMARIKMNAKHEYEFITNITGHGEFGQVYGNDIRPSFANGAVGRDDLESQPWMELLNSAYGRQGQPNEAVQDLLKKMLTHMENLEKERNFYFAKLQDIENLAQEQIESLEMVGQDDETLREIQKILYSTEDGFEAPKDENF